MTLGQSLIESWRDVQLHSAPYALPADKANVERFGSPHTTYASFAGSEALDDPNEKLFHLSLLPQPYIGDLNLARVFLLTLNPGFLPFNLYAEESSAELRAALKANLRQEGLNGRYPFLYLSPEFAWHTGSDYWSPRLRKIVQCLRRTHGADARSHLAKSFCVLQLLPYHSRREVPARLESTRLVKQFVDEELVPRAMTGELLIVVAKAHRRWGLPEHANIIPGGTPRGGHLSQTAVVRICRHLGA